MMIRFSIWDKGKITVGDPTSQNRAQSPILVYVWTLARSKKHLHTPSQPFLKMALYTYTYKHQSQKKNTKKNIPTNMKIQDHTIPVTSSLLWS